MTNTPGIDAFSPPPLLDPPAVPQVAAATYAPTGQPPGQLESVDYVKLDVPGVVDYMPGQAGSVYITGLTGLFPKVQVNGVVKRPSFGGRIKIPLADGTRRTIKFRQSIPGYPKVTMDGQLLYKHPYPPGNVAWVVYLPLLNFLTGVLFGGLLVMIGLHYYYTWLIKRPNLSPAVKIGVPVAISGGLAALNILALIAIIASGS